MLNWGYSHSTIQKCSAFLISLSVCPWLLPVIGCILLASSSENSSQTQLFRILSCREFSTRVLQEGRITVRPAEIYYSRHIGAFRQRGAFPKSAMKATARLSERTARAPFWLKLERSHLGSLKAFSHHSNTNSMMSRGLRVLRLIEIGLSYCNYLSMLRL